MLTEAIYSYLSADVNVQAQLGTPTTRKDKTTGIFPVIAIEQCVMPYAVYTQMTGAAIDSPQYGGTGRLHEARVRFSVSGSTYKQAKVAARVIKESLVAMLGNFASANCQVEGAWWEMEADDAEQFGHATLWTTHLDFRFIYRDAE